MLRTLAIGATAVCALFTFPLWIAPLALFAFAHWAAAQAAFTGASEDERLRLLRPQIGMDRYPEEIALQWKVDQEALLKRVRGSRSPLNLLLIPGGGLAILALSHYGAGILPFAHLHYVGLFAYTGILGLGFHRLSIYPWEQAALRLSQGYTAQAKGLRKLAELESMANRTGELHASPLVLNHYMDQEWSRFPRELLRNPGRSLDAVIRQYADSLQNRLSEVEQVRRTAFEAQQRARRAVPQGHQTPWWQTLGVPADADQATVKKAFRLLAKKWHPDSWGNATREDQTQAADRMKEITEAWKHAQMLNRWT